MDLSHLNGFTPIEQIEQEFADGHRRKLTEAENTAFFSILMADIEKVWRDVDEIRGRCIAQRNVSVQNEASVIQRALHEIRAKLGPFTDG